MQKSKIEFVDNTPPNTVSTQLLTIQLTKAMKEIGYATTNITNQEDVATLNKMVKQLDQIKIRNMR